MVGPTFSHVGPIAIIFASTKLSWPNADSYIYPPPSSDFAMGQCRKMKYTLWIYKLRGYRRGDAAGATPGCPFDSIETISIKREYFIPELWDYGSNILSYSILCFDDYSHMSCVSWLWPYLYHPYGVSFIYEMIYEMQRCFCHWSN
jgi:hypothetical protein